jgi:hypothetical protein
MVTDQQVRRLNMLINSESTKAVAAAKAGMDPKTALKYRKAAQLPSQLKEPHTWRTRPDPFIQEWDQIQELLQTNPGLEAKTIFEHLQRTLDSKYQDGQLRTLQRRIKQWRALEGPAKEVFFTQVHYPGDLSASDFTHMTNLGVTIGGVLFKHLAYHFVLTYSNWENAEVCYSESFESLSEGLQASLWKLGGVPGRHRTDRMSSAVHKDCNPEKFTPRYHALLRHYAVKPERTNTSSANENGDVEQSHHRFKRAVEQALLLRGNRDFEHLDAYKMFLNGVLRQRNLGRQDRFKEELAVLKRLPNKKLGDHTPLEKTVTPSSTVHVLENAYSVHSRLIGEKVQIQIYVNHLEVWYAQKMIERMPRFSGRGNHKINYRHIIDWLVRKPGAFANYRYRADMFPTSHFRMAYDALKRQNPLQADKDYLKILKIASLEGESSTEAAIDELLSGKEVFCVRGIEEAMRSRPDTLEAKDVHVQEVNLGVYDALLLGIRGEAAIHA